MTNMMYACYILEYLFKSTVPIYFYFYYKCCPKTKAKNTAQIVGLSLRNTSIVQIIIYCIKSKAKNKQIKANIKYNFSEGEVIFQEQSCIVVTRGLYYSLFQYNHTYKKLLYFIKKLLYFIKNSYFQAYFIKNLDKLGYRPKRLKLHRNNQTHNSEKKLFHYQFCFLGSSKIVGNIITCLDTGWNYDSFADPHSKNE